MSEPEYTIKKDGVVTTIDMKADFNKGWEQYFLLSADRHFDNPKADNKMAKRHLELMKERNGILLDFGDLVDAMQGRQDRRGSKSDVSETNQKSDYFGSLIDDAVSFFEPYKSNIALIGQGNHESAILKHNEIDLTKMICNRLNDKGANLVNGGYRGWIKFKFNGQTRKYQKLAYYSHGFSNGGAVTKGVISTARVAAYVDSDMVISGHIHEEWELTIPKVKINHAGKETQYEQVHISLPTYKQEFTGTGSGFHHEKGRPPKPLGARWLRFYYDPTDGQIKFETTRAK